VGDVVGAEPPFRSILKNIKKLRDKDIARSLTDVDLSNVYSIEDFYAAIG
jgi:hypothetical protein